MEEMGVPEHMVQVIRSLYANQEAKVRTEYGSSRKMRVLGQSTIHMVHLYTDQPHTWLEHEHHSSSSVFQPHVWLNTFWNSSKIH